jgi:hypothetical protein
MIDLKMAEIKLPIMDRLIQAGYLPVHRGLHVRWTRGHYDNVWFAKQMIQANSNNKGSAIIKHIAGEPNGNVSTDPQGTQELWYTDGYRGRGHCNNLIGLLGAAVVGLFGFGKRRKSNSRY